MSDASGQFGYINVNGVVKTVNASPSISEHLKGNNEPFLRNQNKC